MHNENFNSLLKIIKGLIINKVLKMLFYELCMFRKQYKVYNKKPSNYKTTNLDEKWHADFINDG